MRNVVIELRINSTPHCFDRHVSLIIENYEEKPYVTHLSGENWHQSFELSRGTLRKVHFSLVFYDEFGS